MIAALALWSCGSDTPAKTVPSEPAAQHRVAADPAIGATTELDGDAPAFGDAVLAELTGDEPAARAAYERVLASPNVPGALAARAALYLAQMESRAGRTRHALDLVARATALAPADTVIVQGAAQIQAAVVAATSGGDIRGPRLGTPLPNVPDEVADAFAAAERALAQVHRGRLRIRIESLSRSINERINRTSNVIGKYRAIAERGGLARSAATYRVGSLYHDLALDLVFAELPPELEQRSASDLRATLRSYAITNLKKAVAEYRACIEGAQPADSELWRFAAEADMRRAQDVLRAAGVRISDR